MACSTCGHDRYPFPAPCGPASLKQRRRPAGRHQHPPVSGPLRAGLIEAFLRPSFSAARSQPFPAPCGPASLKQSGGQRRLERDPFPAPCGPASLKRTRADPRTRSRRGPFPAPCGPASLKHAVRGLRPPAAGPVSGPLRAGLIEACAACGASLAGLRPFPAPCGPASLKRRNAGLHPRPAPGPFPAPCGPASLKQGHAGGGGHSDRARFRPLAGRPH